MIPGETSRLELASTAHGSYRSDRVADVLRAEAAGEHHASFEGACTLEMRRIVFLPRKVDDACDLLALAKKHRVPATNLPLLRRIELDEVRIALDLADDDGDREHRVGHVEHARSTTRARVGQDEARHVRAGRRGCANVLLARQPAHLDERPRDELRELRGRIRGAHERRADEDRVSARKLGSSALSARFDPTLRNDDPITRGTRDQPQLAGAIDVERGEVACIDSDHARVERHRALELLGVVRLDERLEAELGRAHEKFTDGRVVQVAQDQQNGIGTGVAGGSQVRLGREEAFGEERKRGGGTRRAKVVPGATEPLVDQDRDGCRPGPFVGRLRSPTDRRRAEGRRPTGERLLTSAIAASPRP